MMGGDVWWQIQRDIYTLTHKHSVSPVLFCFFFGSVTSLSPQHFLLQPIGTPLPVWNSWLSSCSFCNGLNVPTLPPVMVSCFYSLFGVHCPCPPSSCVHLLCHVKYFPFFCFFVFFTPFWLWWKCSHHCMACYLLYQTVAYHLFFSLRQFSGC